MLATPTKIANELNELKFNVVNTNDRILTLVYVSTHNYSIIIKVGNIQLVA